MNKEKEKILLQTYNNFMQIGLGNAPLDIIDVVIDKQITGYGTTIDEKVLSTIEFKELIKRQREQSGDSKINIEFGTPEKRISSNEQTAIFLEDVNIVVETDAANVKIKARISTVLEYADNHWKVIHWHGSTPVESENDTWHKDEWKLKQAELEKQVQEKTAELLTKNRELEIEAAVERVQVRTMAMDKSDELREVVSLIYKGLEYLGIDISFCLILIYDLNSKEMEWWSSGQGMDILPQSYHIPISSGMEKNALVKRYYSALKEGIEYSEFELKDKTKQEWDEFIFNHSDLKNVPNQVKQGMTNANRVMLCDAFMSCGTLEISMQRSLSDEEIFILKRFAKVVDLTFTRVRDLQKAEAQARESQIEAALEKVRSRSLAMHKSDELIEVANTLFEKLSELNIEMSSSSIFLFSENSNALKVWIGMKAEQSYISKSINIPNLDIPAFKAFDHAIKTREPLFMHCWKFEEKNTIWNFLFKTSDFSSIPKERKKFIMDADCFNILFAGNKNTGIQLQRYNSQPFSKSTNEVLIRFANVFEQTYTRFLDLKKSEEQAREAQIEAALEKVRSRSLAMHSASELGEVVALIVEKLKDLDVVLDANGVVLCTYFKETKDVMHWIASPDYSVAGSYLLPYFDHPIFNDAWNSKESGDEYFSKAFSVEEKNSFFEFAFEHSDYKNFPDDFKAWVFQNDKHILSFAWQKNSAILIPSHTGVVPLANDIEILKRFARVFEQAYVRFLDLKKAEARARETQIEASLERVRSRSMAMHKSEELQEVIMCVFNELKQLEVSMEASMINIPKENSKDFHLWIANDENTYAQQIFTPYFKHEIHQPYFDALNKNEKYLSISFPKHLKDSYFKYQFEHSDLKYIPDERKQYLLDSSGYSQSVAFNKHSQVILLKYKDEVFSNEENEILIKFANVFEQTYTRFLDLKKSEEQAREAQIEAALERVRSRTMAMHNSDELGETAYLLFQQMLSLGVQPERFTIGILNKDETAFDFWGTEQGGNRLNARFRGNFDEPTCLRKWYTALKEKRKTSIIELSGKDLRSWIKYLQEEVNMPIDEKRVGEKRVHSSGLFSHGLLNITSPDNLPDEHIVLLERFAGVFQQTYTRFLDLQKAEKQVREAQIEASLERVRAKTMAMHKSNELVHVVVNMNTEINKLGIQTDGSYIITDFVPDNKNETMNLWVATEAYMNKIKLPYLKHEVTDVFFDAVKTNKSFYTESHSKAVKDSYFELLFQHTSLRNIQKERKEFILSKPAWNRSIALLKNSVLIIHRYSGEAFNEEDNITLQRFAKVFEQAYTRFLDLERAEKQTREAQIEASLERIRSQAMAMQHSDDLIKSTTILFEEFEKLNLSVGRSGIGIFDEETRDCDLWTTTVTNEGKTELVTGVTSLTIHPMLIQTFDAWKAQEALPYTLEGKELQDYYKLVSKSDFHLSEESIRNSASLPREYYLYTPFGAGGLYVFSDVEPSKDEKQIIKRFAEVFHLTYTRFEDLQKAEARAKEASKQASLERVRGEIASMRTTDDLDRITPLIWQELNALEVPFIRCGVLIMDNEREIVQTHLSAPDGTAMGIFELPYDSKQVARGAVKQWKVNEIYQDFWDKKKFLGFMESLLELGAIKDPNLYTGSAAPPESLYLNFVPFKQGMLYVGNVTPLDENTLVLVKSLAETFSIAYARYEDFKLLEEAKNKVEQTLSELKSAQTQLVHSEKMASLGELTAGIAHEIQNPLNFVNNFSEISSELIDEMAEEINSGDIDEVKAIASDIKQNLSKINHHGQRASSIVKGMLQHSRTSSGQKELTDINALADECLRLSYHGLRAKDKSFNADFKTEFDESLPKLNIISQDIGRVLLNLINNAFYAVSKKAKENIEGYKPLVTITTSKSPLSPKDRGEIKITVMDNGPGIPDEIKEKIFQPFFTTKPTGSGTGLGLSLSYDIVKAHVGSISIDSKEDLGTHFTITLPYAK